MKIVFAVNQFIVFYDQTLIVGLIGSKIGSRRKVITMKKSACVGL